jgi:chemotaxis protein histidine kinase CheA/CheY-like chemotaxis protein
MSGMDDRRAYLPLYLSDIRRYTQGISLIAHEAIVDPALFMEPGTAIFLMRTGHTMSGLNATMGIPDLAMLGASLEQTGEYLERKPQPLGAAFARVLLRFVRYQSTRVDFIERDSSFMLPTDIELQEAEHIAAALLENIQVPHSIKAGEAEIDDNQIEIPPDLGTDSGENLPESVADLSELLPEEIPSDLVDDSDENLPEPEAELMEANLPEPESEFVEANLPEPIADSIEILPESVDDTAGNSLEGESDLPLTSEAIVGQSLLTSKDTLEFAVEDEAAQAARVPPENEVTQSETDMMEDLPPELLELANLFLASDLVIDNSDTSMDSAANEAAESATDTNTTIRRPLSASELVITPEMLSDFLIEIDEGLGQMRQELLLLSSTRDIMPPLREMGQIAHKLKGAAFMIALNNIGDITRMIETILLKIRQRQISYSDSLTHWLIACIDTLEILRDRVTVTRMEGDAEALIVPLRETFNLLESAASTPLPIDASSGESDDKDDEREHIIMSQAGPLPNLQNQVRIDVARIDQLVDRLNSIMQARIEIRPFIAQSVQNEGDLGIVVTRLSSLYDRLRNERIQAQSQGTIDSGSRVFNVGNQSTKRGFGVMARRQEMREQNASSAGDADLDFDTLMLKVSEVVSDLRTLHLTLQTSLSQLARKSELTNALIENLERDMLKLRMVPVQGLVQNLRWVCTRTALNTHKNVIFRVDGSELEIDRDVSDAIKVALEQLVKNAVVHGIGSIDSEEELWDEPPYVRFHMHYEENRLIIELANNGAPINHHKLIAAAQTAADLNGQRIEPDRVRNMSREEALQLMFLPDVTTMENVSMAAGSGMGLYTVKNDIDMLGGQIVVESEPGRETVFRITLPATLSTIRALPVLVGKQRYAVPIMALSRAAPVDPTQMVNDETGRRYINVPDMSMVASDDQQSLPLITLADLIGDPAPLARGNTALVVRVYQQEYTVLADSIENEAEYVVRPVPHHLRRRGIRGATIAPDGGVILILDLPSMVASAIADGRFQSATPNILTPSELDQGDHILVVDDSPSVRRGLEAILVQAGFPVRLARDGADAIDQMTRIRPRLLILDVEMPQINGYDLLGLLRQHEEFQQLRAIMLTSQGGARHRARARDLGAFAYLVKPCPPGELLAMVQLALSNGKSPLLS